MRVSTVQRLARSAMALYNPPADAGKLIYAPAGHQAHGQAAQFTKGKLSLSDLDRSSPTRQFQTWFAAAQVAGDVAAPEACTLATASLPSGRVSARTVYLKELDAAGDFVVYSNLATSRKAADLAANPHAALVFYWPPLQRQVRVEGRVARASRDESQRYFDTRVRGSRIGAWASPQSQVLRPRAHGAQDQDQDQDDGRAELEERVTEVEKRFEGQDHIPMPDFWGGIRITPDRVEFWQGRDSRLHDRFVYVREKNEVGDGKDPADGEPTCWRIERLSP